MRNPNPEARMIPHQVLLCSFQLLLLFRIKYTTVANTFFHRRQASDSGAYGSAISRGKDPGGQHHTSGGDACRGPPSRPWAGAAPDPETDTHWLILKIATIALKIVDVKVKILDVKHIKSTIKDVDIQYSH